MTAKIISGREVAEHILEKELSKKVDVLKAKNIIPILVVILVGEMKASASYVAQ
jgi:5,10-methylene-tetrahydrofolate dehydrogenase/methenyl tetrahydrofolate cyclohydrolase